MQDSAGRDRIVFLLLAFCVWLYKSPSSTCPTSTHPPGPQGNPACVLCVCCVCTVCAVWFMCMCCVCVCVLCVCYVHCSPGLIVASALAISTAIQDKNLFSVLLKRNVGTITTGTYASII